MKNSVLYFLGITAFIITCVYSCRPKADATAENDIQFDTIHATRNYHINNDSTLPSCNLKLTFVYPVSSGNESILDSLQRMFVSCFFDEQYTGMMPDEAVKNYEDNYVESYKEDYRIYSMNDGNYNNEGYSSYYEIDNSEIKFNKGGILSFQVTKINYKGGAGTYDFLKNYSIDIKSLKLISEEDLFTEGYEKALGKVFRDYLLKIKKVKSLTDLENLGYFGLDEMIPNGNFILDDKGITYIFNKGEYSNYKTDAINIFISYNELVPLLKEDSPISKFVSM